MSPINQGAEGARFTPESTERQQIVIRSNDVRKYPVISSCEHEVNGATLQDMLLATICLASNKGYCAICTLVHCSRNPDRVKRT